MFLEKFNESGRMWWITHNLRISTTCSTPVGPTRRRWGMSIPSFLLHWPAPAVRCLARWLIATRSHHFLADRRVESALDLPNCHASRFPLQRPLARHVSSLKLHKRFNPHHFPCFFVFRFSHWICFAFGSSQAHLRFGFQVFLSVVRSFVVGDLRVWGLGFG